MHLFFVFATFHECYTCTSLYEYDSHLIEILNVLFLESSSYFLPPCLFKVPESGNYTFYVACDDVCELWLDTGQVGQHVVYNEGEETGKVLLAKLDEGYRTDHNQWDK